LAVDDVLALRALVKKVGTEAAIKLVEALGD